MCVCVCMYVCIYIHTYIKGEGAIMASWARRPDGSKIFRKPPRLPVILHIYIYIYIYTHTP